MTTSDPGAATEKSGRHARSAEEAEPRPDEDRRPVDAARAPGDDRPTDDAPPEALLVPAGPHVPPARHPPGGDVAAHELRAADRPGPRPRRLRPARLRHPHPRGAHRPQRRRPLARRRRAVVLAVLGGAARRRRRRRPGRPRPHRRPAARPRRPRPGRRPRGDDGAGGLGDARRRQLPPLGTAPGLPDLPARVRARRQRRRALAVARRRRHGQRRRRCRRCGGRRRGAVAAPARGRRHRRPACRPRASAPADRRRTSPAC